MNMNMSDDDDEKNIARRSDIPSYDHHNQAESAESVTRHSEMEMEMEGGQIETGRRLSIACMLVWMNEVRCQSVGHCL